MFTVPFSISGRRQGLIKTDGVLQVGESHLCVQYETKDTIVGLISFGVKTIEIPLTDIASVEFDPGFWGNTLTVTAKDIRAVAKIPWRDGSQFAVEIRRADRDEATTFADELLWRLDT